MSRYLVITAKCSDCCATQVPHLDIDTDGYVPHIPGIGGGDYIELKIDLDTGTVVGLKPMTDDQIREYLE